MFFDGDICCLLMAFVLFTVQSRCFEVFMRNNRLFKTIGWIFFLVCNMFTMFILTVKTILNNIFLHVLIAAIENE